MRFYSVIASLIVLIFLAAGPTGAMGKKSPGDIKGDAGEIKIRKLVIPGGFAAGDLPEPESRGAKLFGRYCSQCHNLPTPKMHSTDEWPVMFERMLGHLRIMGGRMPGVKVPVGEERDAIVSYLKRHGLKALSEDDPALKSEGAFQLLWFCSICHSPPDPAQHTSEEWRGVVERMEGYRRLQGRQDLTASEKEALIKFLSRDPLKP